MNRFIRFSSRQTMFARQGLIYLYVTAWLIMDIKVEAYKIDCSEEYCFLISNISYASEYLDHSNAQQWCRSNGTKLVEISSKDIQNSLVKFIRSVYSQGLNDRNVLTNGKRSILSWLYLNGNGRPIGTSVNDQTDASYAYGYLKPTTRGFDLFASRPTDRKGGFICTGLSDCSGGVTISGQCYKSFTEALPWYDARNRCLDGGGDLASFDHITTNAGFNALNGSWINPSNSYWIGIKREWWTWQSTYSDVKYSYWMTGHPIYYQANADCLCLSTTEWKWTECGCYPQPFVCISDNNSKTSTTTTSTTTRSTTSTGRPSATASTTVDMSKSTPSVVSESNGVSYTIPATVKPLSTRAENDTGLTNQSMGLSREATIGIGVGVGVGGALVIIALVATVIILCRKRCPLRCPQMKKTNSKGRPPDILMKDSANNHHSSDGIDNPYARIVSSSTELNNADTNAYENSGQSPTVYAQLGFCTEPQLHRDGSVTIVSGKTKPFPAPSPPKNNNATNHFKVGGDLYAEVTKA